MKTFFIRCIPGAKKPCALNDAVLKWLWGGGGPVLACVVVTMLRHSASYFRVLM
jgi:hypothetical protein